MWSIKKVAVVPIIVGRLGTVRIDIENIEEIGFTIRVDHLQKTSVFGATRILRKVVGKKEMLH